MKPAIRVWPAIMALMVLVGLTGCRALPTPPTPPPTVVSSAEELLSRLQNRQKTLQAFQAKGRITFLSPQRNYSGTVRIKARRPASLRADILDIFGRTLLSFASDGSQVQVLSPHEGKFFRGPATPGNLAAFIPPAVTLPQALRLMMGALPLSPGPAARFEFNPSTSQYLLEWRQDNRLLERLWVAAQGLYPVKDEYYGGADRPRFTVELADYGEAAPDLPGKITLETEAPKMELRLAYNEESLNPPLRPADLTLTPPAGIAVVQLP